MNREQRRNIEDALVKKSNKTREQAKTIVKYMEGTQKIEDAQKVKDGDKVKLDIVAIKKHPDYKNLREEYRDFVETNKDTVFTVEFEENRRETGLMACLKEDTTVPKWLFWTGNLLKIN